MLNKMILQGRLTRDVDLKQTQSGVAVANFTVAWSEKYKDNESKLFLDCTAWRAQAEFAAKYFSKGKEVVVEGALHTEEWDDKEGNKRSKAVLTVDKLHFCGSKDGGTVSEERAANDTPRFEELADDDDLPF